MNLLIAKGLAKATVAYTLLTLVRRIRALIAPAAGVGLTRAIRTLGVIFSRDIVSHNASSYWGK